MSWILERTSCRLGHHCRRSKTVVKWNSGRVAHLCRHCYLILWNEH